MGSAQVTQKLRSTRLVYNEEHHRRIPDLLCKREINLAKLGKRTLREVRPAEPK